MDDAMVANLLKTYGVSQPNVRQANAAREFFATNPEIAEKRAMGLRGSGLDDNSDVFGAMLDKLIEQSAPAGTVTVGEPEKVMPTVANASTPNAPRKKVEAPRGGAAPNTEPPPGTVKTGRAADNTAGAGVGASVSNWFDDLWPALLGLAYRGGNKNGTTPDAPGKPPAPYNGPEATFAGRMPRDNVGTSPQERIAANDPRAIAYRQANPTAYGGQIEDNISDLSRVPVNDPAPTTVTGDPALTEEARRRQLQTEVDAENAEAKALQDQIMQREMAKKRTQQLGTAAKQAVGRR